jgi:1-acyl-sn-glycerol-3-phosphate acyltransferase
MAIAIGAGGAMGKRLNHAWRVLATGISFAAFGIGGLLLRTFVFPLLQVCVRNPQRRRYVARRWVQRSFAAHIELMRGLGVLTYEIHGRERLQRDSLLVLANHPTLIDVVFLVSLLPNADCVVKSAVARNPFMRAPVRACGYIVNNDGAGLVDDCIAAVRAGGTLVIFPEGTRSTPGYPLRLRRGAAYIALRGGLDVTPVRISCAPSTLTKEQKWYSVPNRRFHVKIEVGEDFPVRPFMEQNNAAPGEENRAARRLTEHLARYFSKGDMRATTGT